MANYRHLHIRGIGKAPTTFRAKSGGSSKFPPAIVDRAQHAAILLKELDQATRNISVVAAEQAERGVPKNKRGMVLAVEGRPDVGIQPGNSRASSPGLKLYTLQRAVAADSSNLPSDRATFFVTSKTVETLSNNLEAYSEYDGSDDDLTLDTDDEESGRRPRNFRLFESIKSIRPARVRDFWTDPIEGFPSNNKTAKWEVWLRRDLKDQFLSAAREIGIKADPTSTEFIEVSIHNVTASPGDMAKLINASPAIIELRSASSLNVDFLRQAPNARAAQVSTLASRIRGPAANAPRVALLDTGVNPSHPLLRTSINPARCLSASTRWPVLDHSDHGTKMAGVVQYFDLDYALNSREPFQLWTALESVVVTAPPGQPRLAARVAIQRAVTLLEKEEATRVFCLAQTASGESRNGKVTATSAALDLLAYGDGVRPRLFCVAAGNVPTSASERYQIDDYADRNSRFELEAPGQAANVITVGAMTFKASREGLVAPVGDMAPTSRSAESWTEDHPNKPDVVMEGGNFETDPDGVYAQPSPNDLILTTSGASPDKPFGLTGETSAATARASGLLGRLHVSYPSMRAETLRGLIVHSAEWTPAMLAQQRELSQYYGNSEAWRLLISRYGWGVPDDARAYYSTENAFCMVIEDDIIPFEKNGSAGRIKEMKYFKLPWPKQILRALGQTEVEMRCTLSYFIEPDPLAVSRDRYDRYRSFGLRFDVKRFDEDDRSAQASFNANVDSQGRSPDSGWTVGNKLSSRGTLQQDIWRGPAYQLADRDGISVSPTKGWWAEIAKADRFDRPVNFSLIVSLKAPAGNNLFAEVARNAATVLVEQPVTV